SEPQNLVSHCRCLRAPIGDRVSRARTRACGRHPPLASAQPSRSASSARSRGRTMNLGPELLLVGAIAAVGVLHTMVPDHWVPISLIARQRGWSKGETARASLLAGVGHVLSTLLIALAVWLAGVVFASRFGRVVDTASSIALMAFGAWIAVAA